MNSPPEIAQALLAVGTARSKLPIWKMLILGIFAGFYIGIGGLASATASSAMGINASLARIMAGIFFPAGLAMVIVGGSELFTGNSLMILPVLSRQITLGAMLRNWFFVYIGNLLGSIFLAALLNYGHTYSLMGNGLAVTVLSTAVAKVNMPFWDGLIKGIGCNILVCVAVWMATGAKSVEGKIVGLYFPIFIFVMCGLEHSIANMYYIAGGLLAAGNPTYAAAYGGDLSSLTWGAMFIKNLLPVSIGNVIGGAGFVGLGYWLAYLKPAKVPEAATK